MLRPGSALAPVHAKSPGYPRTFCGVCGGPLPTGDRGVIRIPAGTLDDDPALRPQRHIFVDFKAPWFGITDGLPRFAIAGYTPCRVSRLARSREIRERISANIRRETATSAFGKSHSGHGCAHKGTDSDKPALSASRQTVPLFEVDRPCRGRPDPSLFDPFRTSRSRRAQTTTPKYTVHPT